MGNKSALTDSKFWDDSYGTSSKCYPNTLLSRNDYELNKLLKPYLEDKHGGKVIEMGCGDSYMLPYFGNMYGMKVYGVDFSKERVISARMKLAKFGIRGNLETCDFNHIPKTAKGKFDIVYAGGVVEHFESPLFILKLFSEYLKPDGYLITTSPYLGGVMGWLSKKVDKKIYDAHKVMDLDEFINEHKGAGLNVIATKYFMWGGFGVVNYSVLPKILMKMVYGCTMLLDMVLKYIMQVYYWKKLPKLFYSQMFIVAKRV